MITWNEFAIAKLRDQPGPASKEDRESACEVLKRVDRPHLPTPKVFTHKAEIAGVTWGLNGWAVILTLTGQACCVAVVEGIDVDVFPCDEVNVVEVLLDALDSHFPRTAKEVTS